MAARKKTTPTPAADAAELLAPITTRPGGQQDLGAAEFAWVPVSRPKPWVDNPRKNARAVPKVGASIREFGWVRPLVCNTHPDCTDELILGHTALLAAQDLGLAEVPVRFVWMEPEAAHAAALADNKLAELSAWDPELLGKIITSGSVGKPLFSIAGFTPFEFDRLGKPPTASEDDVPERPKRPVSRVGDLWTLGRHRVICGDCTRPDVITRLLLDAVPKMLLTDPPYGVKYDPGWRDGTVHRTKAGANIDSKHSQKVQNDHRSSWLDAYTLFPGDLCYVYHSGKHALAVERDLTGVGLVLEDAENKLKPRPPWFEIRSQIIWMKPNFVVGRGNYNWQHEPCFYGVRKGRNASWIGDRKQSTVWQIAIKAGMMGKAEESEDDFQTEHGTRKPVECFARALRNHQGDAADFFLGSGTCLIAAQQLERACFGVELDPANVDVTVERWQAFTGLKAQREGKPTSVAVPAPKPAGRRRATVAA